MMESEISVSKTIAFFVRNVHPEKYPFSERDLYYHSYQEYLLAMKRAGADAFFVTGKDSYLGDGVFKRAWTIDAVSEVSDFTAVGRIKADLVFDKAGFAGRDVPMVTDAKLHPILDDKTAIYERFGQYQPKTITCNSAAEVTAAIASLPGEMAVVKNPKGAGGKQVYIGTKDTIRVPETETYPLLVQEFIDMSEGIPGVARGAHDVRVLIAGGKIIGATLREPAEGSFHANVSRGGTERLLEVAEIPAEVKRLATVIDGELEDLPRYYAIDFARGKQGWLLMELNNKPGLFRESNGPLARQFMDEVAHYLVGLV